MPANDDLPLSETGRIKRSINMDICPDCSARGFDQGPRGGMTQNIFCRSCGAGFNVARMVVFVRRIGKRHETRQ